MKNVEKLKIKRYIKLLTFNSKYIHVDNESSTVTLCIWRGNAIDFSRFSMPRWGWIFVHAFILIYNDSFLGTFISNFINIEISVNWIPWPFGVGFLVDRRGSRSIRTLSREENLGLGLICQNSDDAKELSSGPKKNCLCERINSEKNIYCFILSVLTRVLRKKDCGYQMRTRLAEQISRSKEIKVFKYLAIFSAHVI